MPMNEEDDTWGQECVNLLTSVATISCLISTSNWSRLSIVWDPRTALEKYAGHICDYLLHLEILWHGTLTFPRLFSHCPSPPLVHVELGISCVPDEPRTVVSHAYANIVPLTSSHTCSIITGKDQYSLKLSPTAFCEASLSNLWEGQAPLTWKAHPFSTAEHPSVLHPHTEAPHYCF